MRSAAAVRVAGSADDGVGNVISIHISAILVIYISKSLVREVAREQAPRMGSVFDPPAGPYRN
jgi:hypothetical protein